MACPAGARLQGGLVGIGKHCCSRGHTEYAVRGQFQTPRVLSFGLLLRFTGVVALGGAVTGILQWLVLRGKVSRAGWWVLASTVGWGLSMTVSRAIPWGVTDGICILLGLVVSGAVLGAVTGAALVWLLRQPVPEAQLE